MPYWRFSSFYLCYFAALGSFIPYWGLYLKDNHFNSAEIGQLSALLVGIKIISPNVWGWMADKSGNSLHLIRWTAFYTFVLFTWFLTAQSYFEFAWLTIVFSFFWNASLPLYEAATLAYLNTEAYRYSRVRLWGSVGFIVAVLCVGKALKFLPVGLLPWLVSICFGLTWLTTLITPVIKFGQHHKNSARLRHILLKPDVMAFLLVYVLIQIAHAPYYVFYSIYLQQHDYSTTSTGLFWSLAVIAEIVLFLFMRRMLKRYSLRQILLTSLLLAVCRWWLIGHYPDYPWVLALAQILHAASFGGSHIAAIHFVHKSFDQNHQSKGQALYHSLSFGLGGMLGSWFSGQYWESLGSSTIFSLASGCCAMAWLIAYRWLRA